MDESDFSRDRGAGSPGAVSAGAGPGAAGPGAAGAGLALFDFDGTITDRETMPDFMRRSVRRGRLRIGAVLLAPLVLGYRLRLVSGSLVRAAICRFGFWRVPVAELERQGEAFARDLLPGTLRPEAMARIEWHRARGDRIVVVSGGLDVYLRPWAQAHGLELLCSSLASRGGRLTGGYRGRQCVREEKARRVRVRYRLADYGRVFAYGDTPEDRELLALADVPYYRGKPAPAMRRASPQQAA